MTPSFAMRPPLLRLLLSLCLWSASVTFIPSGRAQPTPAAPATFRILSMVGSRNDLNYEVSPGKPPVSVPLAQSPSQFYPAPSNGRLELFREIPPPPDAPPGTKPTREIIVTAPLPAAAPQCLVVTFPSGHDARGPLAARVLPHDPEKNRARTVQVLNLSRFPISVALGNDVQTFAIGETRIAPMVEGRLRVLVQAAIQKGDRWESVYRAERRLGPRLRGYIIISDYVQDPDYDADPLPPPVLVRTFFEPAPEIKPSSP